MINLWSSRRDKFHICEYWKVNDDEDLIRPNQLVHEDRPDGFFSAKIVGDETEGKQNIEDAFQFDMSTLTIETDDDVKFLKTNDKVRFREKMYIVTNISFSALRKNSEQFMYYHNTYKYYIDLQGI